MTSIYFNRFCHALVLPVALLGFSANAGQSFIFTNAAPTAIPRRASIIFIQCDGLGYGDLSCYGQAKFQTPNLDKLAAGESVSQIITPAMPQVRPRARLCCLAKMGDI